MSRKIKISIKYQDINNIDLSPLNIEKAIADFNGTLGTIPIALYNVNNYIAKNDLIGLGYDKAEVEKALSLFNNDYDKAENELKKWGILKKKNIAIHVVKDRWEELFDACKDECMKIC